MTMEEQYNRGAGLSAEGTSKIAALHALRETMRKIISPHILENIHIVSGTVDWEHGAGKDNSHAESPF